MRLLFSPQERRNQFIRRLQKSRDLLDVLNWLRDDVESLSREEQTALGEHLSTQTLRTRLGEIVNPRRGLYLSMEMAHDLGQVVSGCPMERWPHFCHALYGVLTTIIAQEDRMGMVDPDRGAVRAVVTHPTHRELRPREVAQRRSGASLDHQS